MAFKKGISGNPSGRPALKIVDGNTPVKLRSSVLSIKGQIERFIKRNSSPKQLQKFFNGLKDSQKIELIIQLLPYVLPKVQAESLSTAEIDALYDKLNQAINKGSGISIADLPDEQAKQIYAKQAKG